MAQKFRVRYSERIEDGGAWGMALWVEYGGVVIYFDVIHAGDLMEPQVKVELDRRLGAWALALNARTRKAVSDASSDRGEVHGLRDSGDGDAEAVVAAV